MVQRGLIVCQICRTDSEMVVVNYFYSEVASRSPVMLIQGNESKMFQVYQNEFDQLWKLNEQPVPISGNQSNDLS